MGRHKGIQNYDDVEGGDQNQTGTRQCSTPVENKNDAVLPSSSGEMGLHKGIQNSDGVEGGDQNQTGTRQCSTPVENKNDAGLPEFVQQIVDSYLSQTEWVSGQQLQHAATTYSEFDEELFDKVSSPMYDDNPEEKSENNLQGSDQWPGGGQDPPREQQTETVSLTEEPVPCSSRSSRRGRKRGRKITSAIEGIEIKVKKIPKYKMNPNDPNLSKTASQAIKNAIKTQNSRNMKSKQDEILQSTLTETKRDLEDLQDRHRTQATELQAKDKEINELRITIKSISGENEANKKRIQDFHVKDLLQQNELRLKDEEIAELCANLRAKDIENKENMEKVFEYKAKLDMIAKFL